jgi:hypothetical protein
MASMALRSVQSANSMYEKTAARNACAYLLKALTNRRRPRGAAP